MSLFEYDPGGRSCRVCGCDDAHACYDPALGGGCAWVEPDLCSACARRANGAREYPAVAPLSARLAAAAYVRVRTARRRAGRRWARFYGAWAAMLALAWVLS